MKDLDVMTSPKLDLALQILYSTRATGSVFGVGTKGNVSASTSKGESWRGVVGKTGASGGLDFIDYREYIPGDDVRLIDWKASKRINKLLIKEYEVAPILNLYFLFDVSNSMVFGSTEVMKYEFAAEIIASLSYSALKTGNGVSVCFFNEHVVDELPLDAKKSHFYLLMNKLTRQEIYGGGYDLGRALMYILGKLEENSLLFIVSDFIGFKEEWLGLVSSAAKKAGIICLMIRDPRDEKLPEEGVFLVRDPFSDKKIVVDSKNVNERYERNALIIENKINKLFLGTNSRVIKLMSNEDYLDKLVKFLMR